MVVTVATTVLLSATRAVSANEDGAGGSDVALVLFMLLPLPPPPHAVTATTQMTPSANGAIWRKLFFIAALHKSENKRAADMSAAPGSEGSFDQAKKSRRAVAVAFTKDAAFVATAATFA
jgi:hypothetical protein